ncbi:MAG: hypothetical protein RIC36_12425 [Rhodospirillales bacterium]
MQATDIRAIIATRDPIFARLLRVLLETSGVRDINMSPVPGDLESTATSRDLTIVFAEWNADVPRLPCSTAGQSSAINDNDCCPLILVGSEHSLSIITKARKRGASGYISAPVGLKSVQAWIAGLLEGLDEMIMVPGYLGPERRRCFDIPAIITDRRHEPAHAC